MKAEVPQDVLDILNRALPDEAVKQHPTKTYLSSIKAIYVTERFTEAFGLGGWTFKTEIVEKGSNGMVVVKVCFEVPKYGIYYESYGGNDNGGENSKNFDLGDAYKGATTDALTKIGSFLGVGIDVFKGKKENNPAPAKKVKVDHWMTESEFTQAQGLAPAMIEKLLKKYDNKTPYKDGKVYGMKKEYREQLKSA